MHFNFILHTFACLLARFVSFFSEKNIPQKEREREGEKRATIVLKIFSTDKRTNTEHIPPVITFLCKQQLRYAHALIGRNSSGRNTSCKHKRRTCTIDSCPWKITRSKFAFSFPRKVCYETTRLWSTDSTAKWVRHLNSSPNFIQTLENDSFVLFNRRGNLSFVRVISIWPEEETNCEQRRGFRRGFVWFVAFDRSTRDGEPWMKPVRGRARFELSGRRMWLFNVVQARFSEVQT